MLPPATPAPPTQPHFFHPRPSTSVSSIFLESPLALRPHKLKLQKESSLEFSFFKNSTVSAPAQNALLVRAHLGDPPDRHPLPDTILVPHRPKRQRLNLLQKR